jgi:transposase
MQPGPAAFPPPASPGAPPNDRKSGREGIGRSRGGLTTKIHLAADLRCRPVARLTSPGQHGDSPYFPADGRDPHPAARAGQATPPARPRDGRQGLLLRREPRLAAGPPHHSRDPGQGRPEEAPPQPRSGRRPAAGLRRRLVQGTQHRRGCFSKLKQFRAVAARYDKRERLYQGTIDVASIRIWLRVPVP